jgi:diguanylate cyclase (GGDEF)-like protein
MRVLIRHIAGLITIVVFFLAVLGIFIWERHESVEAYTIRNEHFFAPSRQHLANAMLELERVISQIGHDASADGARPQAVPFRFQLQPSLNVIGENLNDVVRSTTTLEMLTSVDNVLKQLKHIYDIEHLEWQQREREAALESSQDVIRVGIVLFLVAGLLIAGVVNGLRTALRHETRTRNDLEEARNNLATLALYDELTGLGNRNLFKSHLEQATSVGRRSPHPSALLYIDVDNFKRINDSLGHDVGDEVLKIIGARLQKHVREGDTVARIGGDEFTIILYETAHGPVVGSIARKLLHSIREPVMASGHELVLSASIGITVMPGDGTDPAVLMKNADMALYKAKDLGRNNFQFFVEEMNREATHQAMLERELRAAIPEQRFKLHYQTQVDLDSGEITTLEALLRWSTSDGKAMAPDQFIPVAESTGLLVEIGGWVLNQACQDLATLRALGHEGLQVAVNLSARQLHDPKLLTRIENALESAGLKPDALEVEITETTLIEDIDAAVEILQTLRQLGISVAVDDFGIGYSSLSYLRQLPLDVLKIDRSFVRDIEFDAGDRSIVDAILAMGRSLSLKVVAEGIENQWQMDYLTQRGCDRAQGFLLARPVPRDQLSFPVGDTGSSQGKPRARGGLHLV